MLKHERISLADLVVTQPVGNQVFDSGKDQNGIVTQHEPQASELIGTTVEVVTGNLLG